MFQGGSLVGRSHVVTPPFLTQILEFPLVVGGGGGCLLSFLSAGRGKNMNRCVWMVLIRELEIVCSTSCHFPLEICQAEQWWEISRSVHVKKRKGVCEQTHLVAGVLTE